MPTLQTISADSIRHVVSSVLSGRAFSTPEPSPLGRALGRFWDWVWGGVGHVADWVMARLDVTSPGWQIVGRIALLALAAVGVWIVVRLVRVILASREPHRRGGSAGETGAPRPRTVHDWELAARAAAHRGRWREASVALYHAVVLRLATEGRVEFSPCKTPGEYRREVASHAELAAPVAAFLSSFERVAFARARPGEGDYARLVELAAPVRMHG